MGVKCNILYIKGWIDKVSTSFFFRSRGILPLLSHLTVHVSQTPSALQAPEASGENEWPRTSGIRKEKKAARGHRKRRYRAANRRHLRSFPVSVFAPDLASKKACCRWIRGLSSLSHCPSTPTVSHTLIWKRRPSSPPPLPTSAGCAVTWSSSRPRRAGPGGAEARPPSS
jgi:hypothetical protein